MKPKYCYWSVCDGAYGAMMEHCVRTAREAGVFKEFHVLCDRPLEGCECYDAYQFDKTCGLFKLHYLKVGMSRLNFDYFVWIDADTVFARNPVNVLGASGKSPIHVPLEASLTAFLASGSSQREETQADFGFPICDFGFGRQHAGAFATLHDSQTLRQLHELFRQEGIVNQVYVSGSAFWIVHHDAIEAVYELALGFWHKGKEAGLALDVSAALGYAMHILCADPEAHLLTAHPELWSGDNEGWFREQLPHGAPWLWRHPLRADAAEVHPAILHRPQSSRAKSE